MLLPYAVLEMVTNSGVVDPSSVNSPSHFDLMASKMFMPENILSIVGV